MNLIGLVLGFVLSAWLTWRLCDPASRFHILDHPNERSLHARPTPRSGGLAILAVIALGLVLIGWRFDQTENLSWLLLSMLLVAVVSFVDDRHHVPIIVRLLMHLIAAAVLLWGGFSLRIFELPGFGLSLPAVPAALVSLIFVVWMVNLYNFMDGMDGFAAGMAVIGFGAFALLGWWAGNSSFMWSSLIVAAAASGFLMFNFPPARIFMGDVGSSTLGLMAAAFSLWGARDHVIPFWASVLVFSPFIMDATVTLLRRLWRREKVWQAHKTHYYQKLVQAGWGHRKTVLFEYGVMLGCGMTALWGVHAPSELQMAMLAGWALFYFVLFAWVSRLTRRCYKTGTL